MSISIRYFVVSNGDLKKLSRKKFKNFYFDEEAALPEYSGQTIEMAEVCVEVFDRAITRIIRIDCERYKVDKHGAIDKEHKWESIIRIFNPTSFPQSEQDSTVIDATNIFKAKRLEHKFRWELTDEIRDQIFEILKI